MPSIILSLGGRIFSSIAMILRHPILIYKMKNGKENKKDKIKEMKNEYEIPKYNSDMKFCSSKEKYLRPVRLCESNDPSIISIAEKLGSFKVSDREYAKNVFNFVKNNIKSKNIPVLGAVKTLKEGHGSCFDAASLFIALCRCGGVKARYKIYLHKQPPEGFQTLSETLDQSFLDGAAIIAAFYTLAEVKIDGKWLECEISSNPELDVFWNVPIAKFGEKIGTVGGWTPDNVVYFEKLPRRLVIPTNIMFRFLAGMMEEINNKTELEWQEGKKKLDKIDRKEYDKKARRRYGYVPSLEEY